MAPQKQAEKTKPNRSQWLLNARIIDPEAQTEQRGHLEIRDGHILRVTTALPKLTGANRTNSVDLKGAWLLPAFADLHVHSWGNPSPQSGPDHSCGYAQTARLMLYAGVVAYVDLGAEKQAILRLRDRLRARLQPGATLYAAGPVMGQIAGMKALPLTPNIRLLQTNSPEEGRRHVRRLAKAKPDFIKVLMDHTTGDQNLSVASLNAIVKEAKKQGIRVICHIGTWKDAQACVAAGVSAVTHLWDEHNVPPSLVAALVKQHIALIPTQPVQVDIGRYSGSNARGWQDPLLRAMTPQSLQDNYRQPKTWVKKARFWLRYQGPHTKAYERQLLTLHRGGVTLLAGSDSGNFGTFQGYSLHREMALMVRAGLPIWAALRAATTAPGRFLGRKLGVRPGDEASFVMLSASPLVSISHTQRIAAVMFRGDLVDRPRLLLGMGLGDR